MFLRTGWSSGGGDHLVLGVGYADKSLCSCMEVIHMLIIRSGNVVHACSSMATLEEVY